MKAEENKKKESNVPVVTDGSIESGLKEALAKSPNLKVQGLVVHVKSGEVTLEGKVSEKAQIDRITALAEHMKGVKGVVNKIAVQVAEKMGEGVTMHPSVHETKKTGISGAK